MNWKETMALYAERNKQIVAMRKRGETLQAIANEFDVKYQRVQAILKRESIGKSNTPNPPAKSRGRPKPARRLR